MKFFSKEKSKGVTQKKGDDIYSKNNNIPPSEAMSNFFVQKSSENEYKEEVKKNIFMTALSEEAFAITIDTYFPNNPHSILDFYLCDLTGTELFHIKYTSNGLRSYKFSQSGRFFVLMDTKSFYIYDLQLRQLNVFFPDSMEMSDSLDFLIFEERKCIAYTYTHHPDKPTYHFTFSGMLVEEIVFKNQIEKMNYSDIEEQELWHLFEKIDNAERPLSDEIKSAFLKELKDYSLNSRFKDSPWVYRKLGELELETAQKHQALAYFEKALALDPNIGVKRIATKLKKELDS